MRLEVAQYRELAAFAQFSSDLDLETKTKLERGKRIVEILKQPQYVPMPVEDQVAVFFAVTSGLMDDVPVLNITQFESGMLESLRNKTAVALKKIKDSGDLDEESQKQLTQGINDYKDTLDYLEEVF
jgi:F-type H+-transporting ATPase subunit alpha